MTSMQNRSISPLRIAKAKTEINKRLSPHVAIDNKDNIHFYKVGYVPNGGKGTPSPAIKLGGRWLADFGFIPGQEITVSAQQGVLMIKNNKISSEIKQLK